MIRRSTPAAKRDDEAYPIRLKFAVPPFGLGKQLDEINAWLRNHLEPGAFAVHSARAFGGSAMAIHFLAIEDALQFRDAFPELPLALPPG